MFEFLKDKKGEPPALPEGTVRRRYSIEGEDIVFSPVLPENAEKTAYRITSGDTVLEVNIRKRSGFARVTANSSFRMDGVPFAGRIKRPADGKTHVIEITV